MKHLIIYVRQRENGLNKSILDKVEATYRSNGHEVVVRDLYALNFNPVLTASDFEANQKGELPADIRTEQEFIRNADVITIIHPVWWTGFPAILKGYFDRVLLYGFAYSFGKEGLIKLLTGKKALLFSTHGLPKEAYEPAMYNALKLTSDTGVMDFCGIEVLHHEFFSSATSAPESVLAEYVVKAGTIAEKFNNG